MNMLRSNKCDNDDNMAFRDGDEKETYLNIISNLIPRRNITRAHASIHLYTTSSNQKHLDHTNIQMKVIRKTPNKSRQHPPVLRTGGTERANVHLSLCFRPRTWLLYRHNPAIISVPFSENYSFHRIKLEWLPC